MNLLITPAISLTEEQKAILCENHTLFFIEDERVPLSEQQLSFDPAEIEGIVCNFFFLHNSLSALPNLRFIQLTSVGLDRVPESDIREKNIALFTAGSIYAVPIAEWAVGKILEILKCSTFFYDNQKLCKWEKNRNLRELSGMNALIFGFGNIGKNIAKRLRAFDVNIYAVDIPGVDTSLCDNFYTPDEAQVALSTADIVILCLPLTEKTRGFMNKEKFSSMKQGALLLNAARGALIDEVALKEALESGHLYAAALDAFDPEPIPEDSMLWKLPNTLITPHNSFVGNGNSQRLFNLILKNLNAE